MSDLNDGCKSNDRDAFVEDMSSVDFQLDAYLDGTLSPEHTAEFERAIAADAGLARQVDAARRVDAELRQMFAPPTVGAGMGLAGIGDGRRDEQTVGSIRHEPAGVLRPARSRGRLVGLAAAGLLLVAAALVVRFVTAESDQGFLVMEFDRQVQGGFKPAIVCTTNEAFAEWTRVAFGQPLEPLRLASNVELLGWSKSNLVPGYSGLLLARVDGKGVMVVMDRPAEFGSGGDGRLGKLRTFERHVGGVRMIEVTPLDRPMLVDSIVLATPATPVEPSNSK
jgi:hypothetical protein